MRTRGAQVTPERIFATLNAHQNTAALRAAIEVDVLTAIGEGAATPAAIAAKTGASVRGVPILCDYLAVQKFLTRHNGRYALTPDTALFLNRHSRAYLGGISRFLNSDRHMEPFRR